MMNHPISDYCDFFLLVSVLLFYPLIFASAKDISFDLQCI